MGRKARQATMADSKIAVGYLRVSTEDQNLGPEAQRAALERYAQAHGLVLAGTEADLGVSGGALIEKRPGLLSALAALTAHGAGVLLVAKRDRLARDPIVSAMVERLAERSGAKIVSADGAGNGDDLAAVLMRRMVDTFAEYERALIRARTKSALAVKAARGERVGTVPYGFRVLEGGRLGHDDAEQATIARVRGLRAAGATFQAIVDELNAAGVPARGQRWHLASVHAIVRREAA
jgi:DNA invertase Pin-like site-specific DNA recombinase